MPVPTLYLPGPGPLLNPQPEAGRAAIDRAFPTPARSFDGVDDRIGAGAPNQTGALTMAALVRRTRSGAIDWVMLNADSSLSVSHSMRFNASDQPTFNVGGSSVQTGGAGSLVTEVDGWVIFAVTKPAGSATVRFHIFKSGAWTHANAGSLADPAANSGVLFATSILAYYPIDLAIAAQWTSELSDANIETLDDNRATADWTALAPQALWEFDQTTTAPPPDLSGNGYHGRLVDGTTAITTGPVPWTYSPDTTTVVLLGASAAISDATLAVTAPSGGPAIIPLETAAATSAATLALTAPAITVLATAAATSSATLALTAPAKVTLGQADAVSTATLALTAPAKLTLGTSAAVSSATLALNAPAKLTLQADAVSSATLALYAPGTAFLTLETAAATSSATLALSAKTEIPLQSSAAVSSATLALSAQTKVVLGQSDAVSSATLALTAPAKVTLATSAAVSTATLALTAATKIVLATSAATSSATLALTAQTKIVLGQADALSAATLALFAPGGGVVPLNSAVITSSATLALTAAGQVVLQQSTAVSTATLTLVAKTTIVLGPAGATSTATLDVTIPGAPSGAGLRMPVLMLILDDDD